MNHDLLAGMADAVGDDVLAARLAPSGRHLLRPPRRQTARTEGPVVDWAGWAVFGLVATTGLTAVMIVAQLAGRTRLDLPLMLGTITTEDPDRARVAGFAIHLAIGQVLRPLLRRRFRRARPLRLVARRALRPRPRRRRAHRAGPAAAGRPPAHGQRARRSRLDRRARTPWTVRPQLRHRHPAGRGRRPRRLRRRARAVPRERLTMSVEPLDDDRSSRADRRLRADR